MKKICGTVLFNCCTVLALAQDRKLPEDEGFFHQICAVTGNWLPYLALLSGVVAIVLCTRQSRRLSKLKKQLEDQRLKLSWVREDVSRKANLSDLANLAGKGQAPPPEVIPAGPTLEKVWEIEKKATEPVVAMEPAEQLSAPAAPDRQLFYAKLADLEDGFSAGIMDTQQNGEQVYEIKTEGDSAVYGISSDAHAQKYALAESTFTLGKACELLNQPFKGCRILLQREGTLVKIAGNWIIQQKAQIEFK